VTLVNPDIDPESPERAGEPVAGRRGGLTRRERVHRATKADLVAASRELLVEQGLTAVTVRAVAARLGMTAPAIYRYYDSREALLEAVIDELYDEIADELEVACESQRDATLTDRFAVTSRAFRRWALDHRAEFGLLFGAPIPGVGTKGHNTTHIPLEPGPADTDDVRGMRFMLVWLRLFLEVSASGIELPEWPRPIPAGLREQLANYVERLNQPLSVDLALLFLTCWQALYGFICTEAFGHLSFAIDDGDEMFEDRLAELKERLRLP
jgi:AcrR family transcriptional regulator